MFMNEIKIQYRRKKNIIWLVVVVYITDIIVYNQIIQQIDEKMIL